MTDHSGGAENTALSQKSDSAAHQTLRANVAARISRRWPVIAATAAGIFTIGHAVGGVEGFIVGYKHAIEYFVPPHTSPQNSWTKLNAELREEFLVARDKFEQSGSADFSRADFAIMHIRKVDDRNSAVWYFAGEIKRIKKSEWFTIKSCVKSDGQIRDLTSYQQDFYRYLDDAKAVSFKDIGNKLDSSSCYENQRGFCPQRIAWIHHLLANDFFEQAKTVLDPREKIDHLKLVLQHSAEATKYEHEGRRGFVQCTDTGVLQEKAREQINSMSGSDVR